MRKFTLASAWIFSALTIATGAAFGQSADLSVIKTDSPDPVAAGSNVTYTILVTNNGPNTATNVVLNDVLPTGPTFVSAQFTGGSLQGTCTQPTVGQTGGTFNCTFPALTSGQNSQYQIILHVPDGSSGSISNTATVTSDTSDPNPGNNSATQGTTINSNADMAITKTDSPDPVAAGSNVTYTILVTNNGPATAQSVVWNDVLPIGPTFVSAQFTGGSLQGTCTQPTVGQTGGTFNCTYPALLSGQNSQYQIILHVPDGSSGSFSNTATVSASNSTTDPNPANNSATQGTTINSNADMAITKTDSPDPVAAGSNVTYTILVTNNGPATAQSVVWNDVLPIGPTFVSAQFTGGSLQGTCTQPTVGQTGGTFNCTYPALLSGQNSQYQIILHVPDGSSGSFSNTATVSASNSTTDPNPANNSATQGTTINSNADMAITKTDSPDPVAAGSNVTYTILVTNNGPATAQSVVWNDVLPIGPTFVSAQFTGGSLQGTCTQPTVGQTGGTFNCTYPALLSGQNSQYQIILHVPDGSSGSFSNTATVSASNSTTDPNPANNSATQGTTINSNADMAITKTDSPDPVAAGSNVTYTILVTNNGPATAQSVVWNDVLPIGPTFVSAQFTGGSLQGTCTQPTVGQTGGTFNCTYPALLSGQNSQYQIILHVPDGSSGSFSNTATVSASNSTTDPNPANNSATQGTTINSNADMAITKTDSPDPVAAGSNVTYTILVTNNGPATAQSVVWNDVLPIGPTFVSAQFTGGSLQGTCTQPTVGQTGGTFNCTYPALLSGQNSQYQITLNVPTSASGTITNTATVAASNSTTDPNANNNSATATTDVLPATSLTKAFNPTTIAPGGTTTLTFTLTNPPNRPSQVVSFVDTLPSKLQIAAVPNVVNTCTGGSITATAGGSSFSVSSATVPASTASASTCTISVDVTNVAQQSGTCPDANLTNSAANISGVQNINNAVTASCVTVTQQMPSLIKSFGPTAIAPGGTTTLTFTISNPASNNPAQAVSFIDTLPSKLQIAATPGIVNNCSGGTVTAAAGGNTINVSGTTVAASTATASSCTISVNVTNVAQQSGTCPDANLTNSSANISGIVNLTSQVTPSCVSVTQQTASLNKAFNPTTIAAGGTTTLTFTLTNPATNNPAQAVSFADTLPTGLRVAATPNVGGTCTGGTVAAAAGGNVITVTGRTVPASGGAAATCTVTVDVTNVAGQLNGSCASTPTAFTNAGGNISGLSNLNNAVTSSCLIVNGNTFTIAKVASASSLLPNSPLSYTITTTNNGPSAADGSVLTDPAVPGFTASSVSCTNAANGAVCPVAANVTLANLQGAGVVLPTFPANGTVTFVLSGTFTLQNGGVTNTATIATALGVPLQTQSSAVTVTVQTVGAATIPTLADRALLALMLVLAAAGATYLRRGKR